MERCCGDLLGQQGADVPVQAADNAVRFLSPIDRSRRAFLSRR
jgi:hypothetical protein